MVLSGDNGQRKNIYFQFPENLISVQKHPMTIMSYHTLVSYKCDKYGTCISTFPSVNQSNSIVRC